MTLSRNFELIIVDELERRTLLSEAIDTTLEAFFVAAPGRRIKRGIVHNTVSSVLGIRKSNEFCILINERVKARGIRPYIMMGALYFKHFTKR